jgi:hypothetical protein
MRNDRVSRFERRTPTPTAGLEARYVGGRRRRARLWPLCTVLRRVERLVEAEEAQERDSPFSTAAGGDEPNA